MRAAIGPDDQPDQALLEVVTDPHARRHAVEAVALLDAEGVPGFQRHLDQRADDTEGRQQGQLVGQPAPLREDEVAHGMVECVQPAHQRPAQQHRRADGGVDQAEAQLVERVIGRTLVAAQRHLVGKGRRHGIAVARHVPGLARIEPELDEHGGRDEKRKKQGDGAGRHAASVRLPHNRRPGQRAQDRTDRALFRLFSPIP